MNVRSKDQKIHTNISLDNLIKLIPAAFLYFGFVYLDSYFRYFGISISSFYGFDEFIVIFLPIIDILIPFAVVLLMLWFFIHFSAVRIGVLDRRFNPDRIDQFRDKTLTTKKKVIAFLRFVSNWTVIRLICFLILSYMIQNSEGYKRLFLYLGFGLFAALLAYDFFSFKKVQFLNLEISPGLISILFYLVIFWLFTRDLGLENAKSAQARKVSVSFQYEGSRYQTTRDTIIVGDTKRYIILRSRKESTNFFFERDRITLLKIRNQ